ncbi:MAG: hypothetical protein FWF97_01320 [Alphaproteobacteria bacterium]|nr:hypothetical protein [Alphaproteobacteria bacterium]
MTESLIPGILPPLGAPAYSHESTSNTEWVVSEQKNIKTTTPAEGFGHHGLVVGKTLKLSGGTAEVIEILSKPIQKAALAKVVLTVGSKEPQNGYIIKRNEFVRFEADEKIARKFYDSLVGLMSTSKEKVQKKKEPWKTFLWANGKGEK